MTSMMSWLDSVACADQLFATDATIELHATDRGQVVTLWGVEQALEQAFDGILGGRLAWTHHAVDGNPGGPLVGGFVNTQGRRNVRATVEIVDVERLEILDAGFHQFRQQSLGNLVVGVGQNFAGLRVDHVLRHGAADDKVLGDGDLLDCRRRRGHGCAWQ